MTIKAVEWALKREGISSTAKLVLVMLCDCINAKDEFAFPRQERISQVVGRSERQVRRHLRTLEEEGLVEVISGQGAGRGRGRTTDRYRIACDHLTGEDRPLNVAQCGTITGGHERPPVEDTGGQKEHPVNDTGGRQCPIQADADVRRTIEEPEKEPELPIQKTEPEQPKAASDKPKSAKLDGRRALELFNEAAVRCGWCVIKDVSRVSEARKQAVRARLREHGMEGWEAQLAIAEEMPFLRGENDRGWRMGIDYFARPSGWAKIEEGGFKRVPSKAAQAAQAVTHEEAKHHAARTYYESRGRWPKGYTPPSGALT